MDRVSEISRRIIGLAALTIILTSISGCSATEEDIIQYGEAHDFEKLVRYIEKNQQNSEKVELVQLAATQLFSQYLLNDLWEKVRTPFYKTFGAELARYSLLVKNDFSSHTFIQRAVMLLVSDSSRASHWDAAKLMALAVDLELEPRDSLQIIRAAIDEITSLETKLARLKVEHRDLNYAIGDARDQATKDEQWMIQNYPVKINGITLALQEDGIYEVFINQQSALLITTESRFNTQGRFQLFATELAEMPVTLKPEFGGDTQKWKLYREVPRAELDVRFEMANKKRLLMAKAETRFTSKMVELQMLDKKLAEIPQEIGNLKEKAYGISLLDVSYKGVGQ